MKIPKIFLEALSFNKHSTEIFTRIPKTPIMTSLWSLYRKPLTNFLNIFSISVSFSTNIKVCRF